MMKRLISCALVLMLALSAAACAGGDSEDKQSGNSSEKTAVTDINVAQYASEGKISGFVLTIGNSMGDVRAQFSGDLTLRFEEAAGFYTLIGGNTTYFIDKSSYEVVGILTKDQAYGIRSTATPDELAEYLGQPTGTATPADSTAMIYGSDTGDRLSQTYEFGDYRVTFYFLSGRIYSTMLYRSAVSLASSIGG